MILLGIAVSGAVVLAAAHVDAAESKASVAGEGGKAGEGGAGGAKNAGDENKAGAEEKHTCQHAEKLRAEIEALKDAVSGLEAQVKSVDERTVDATTHSDLEALRDIEEENILRSVGSSSAVSPYPVNGGLQHLVNLTGSSALLYTATPWSTSGTSTRSLRINLITLALAGKLRDDPGTEGDVRYNIGFLATQNRYAAVANTSQSGGSAAASTVAAGTVNGTYLNASDVWVALDIKTTKLELEPWYTLSLQLGQFLTPYGIEAVSTENNRPTINQAQFVSRLGFTRDLGLIATGGLWHRNDPSATTVPLIGYTFGIFDGSGPNTFDTNTGLDVLGRLTLSPFYRYADNFRNLTIGANWYEGNLWSSTGTLPKKRRLGGDLSWLRKPFLLTAEYIYSRDGYEGDRNAPVKGSGIAPTGTTSKASSFVGTLFFTPGTLPDFQPWARFDLWRPWPFTNLTDAQITSANSAGNWGNRRDAYSIGFNWFVWATEPVVKRSYDTSDTWRVLKLQASYTRFRQEAFTGAKNQIDVNLQGSF